jgi:putative membrane protein
MTILNDMREYDFKPERIYTKRNSTADTNLTVRTTTIDSSTYFRENRQMNETLHSPSLQEVQAELASTRTVLALDRTLLAWVRTSLSLNAFGFTLAKFVHNLIVQGNFRGIDAEYPRVFGLTLMVLGILGLCCGVSDYWRSVKRMKTAAAIAVNPWSSSLVVSILLLLVSTVLVAELVTGTHCR